MSTWIEAAPLTCWRILELRIASDRSWTSRAAMSSAPIAFGSTFRCSCGPWWQVVSARLDSWWRSMFLGWFGVRVFYTRLIRQTACGAVVIGEKATRAPGRA